MQTYYITCIYTKYSRIIKRRESGVFSGRKLQNDNISNSNIATTSEIVIVVVQEQRIQQRQQRQQQRRQQQNV